MPLAIAEHGQDQQHQAVHVHLSLVTVSPSGGVRAGRRVAAASLALPAPRRNHLCLVLAAATCAWGSWSTLPPRRARPGCPASAPRYVGVRGWVCSWRCTPARHAHHAKPVALLPCSYSGAVQRGAHLRQPGLGARGERHAARWGFSLLLYTCCPLSHVLWLTAVPAVADVHSVGRVVRSTDHLRMAQRNCEHLSGRLCTPALGGGTAGAAR